MLDLFFSHVFLSQSCSVFFSCDMSTVTDVIRGSRELTLLQFVFAQQKEHESDHLHALHYHLILTRLPLAAAAAAVVVVYFGDDSHGHDARHSHHCEDRRDAETAH